MNGDAFQIIDSITESAKGKVRHTTLIDTYSQVLYRDRFDKAFYELDYSKRGQIKLGLTHNCRNSPQIAHEASYSTGYQPISTLAQNAFEVSFDWFESDTQLIAKTNHHLEKLLSQNVKPHHISIISDSNVKKTLILDSIHGTETLDVLSNKMPDNFIVDTDRRFKGLDNSAVITICTEFDKDNHEKLSRLYVAITRARVMLIMMMSKKIQHQYERFRMENVLQMR